MSKLYIDGRVDMSKKGFSRRANRYIDLSLGYDESDYNKKINVRLNRPETGEYRDKIVLWVDGEAVKVVLSPYIKGAISPSGGV